MENDSAMPQNARRMEHLERLQAMSEDHGETWDLSDNDQAALKWAVQQISGNHPLPPPQARTPRPKWLDEFESVVRIYRHKVHSAGCECPECRTLLKALVSLPFTPEESVQASKIDKTADVDHWTKKAEKLAESAPQEAGACCKCDQVKTVEAHGKGSYCADCWAKIAAKTPPTYIAEILKEMRNLGFQAHDSSWRQISKFIKSSFEHRAERGVPIEPLLVGVNSEDRNDWPELPSIACGCRSADECTHKFAGVSQEEINQIVRDGIEKLKRERGVPLEEKN